MPLYNKVEQSAIEKKKRSGYKGQSLWWYKRIFALQAKTKATEAALFELWKLKRGLTAEDGTKDRGRNAKTSLSRNCSSDVLLIVSASFSLGKYYN